MIFFFFFDNHIRPLRPIRAVYGFYRNWGMQWNEAVLSLSLVTLMSFLSHSCLSIYLYLYHFLKFGVVVHQYLERRELKKRISSPLCQKSKKKIWSLKVEIFINLIFYKWTKLTDCLRPEKIITYKLASHFLTSVLLTNFLELWSF